MKMRFFDFEVFAHWWLCVFGDLPEDMSTVNESIKDDFVIVTSDMPNAREKLLAMFREDNICSCGYNIKGYDLIIANGIYQGFTPEQIKILNDIIINPSTIYSTKEHMRIAPLSKKRLSGICYQDLMDDTSGTLKEKEAILGLNILESSVNFNQEDLDDADKDDVIYYCRQDVYAAMQFYIKVAYSYTMTKLAIGEHFNIPVDVCHKSTNAKLVSLALGAVRSSYSDEERADIELPSKIKQYCYDNMPSKVLERIRTSADGFTIQLFDNKVSFGNGGIHSVYSPEGYEEPCLYLETDDEWCLVNVDAASYYPSEMKQFKLLSRSVRNPQVFTDIYNERIAIKHKENKTKQDDMIQLADKLVLNTTFGASGNKYLDLYDPYMCTSVCRTGQIFLGALACKIHKTVRNVIIVQTNTDGILCYLPKRELDALQKCMDEWMQLSGITLELDEVDKIWQRDVNNYLLIKHGGKVKRKGAWLNDTWERPGTVKVGAVNAFACTKAAIEFLVNGTDPIQTLIANKNLGDFVMTCTKGPTYRGVIQRMANGNEIELYKANRVIATKDTNYGRLYKVKMFKGNLQYTQMPSTPEHCKTLNADLSAYNFNDIAKSIDYMYYVERVIDLLDIDWYSISGNKLYKNNNFDYMR